MCITKIELESKVQELRSLKTMKEELENELKAVEREIISYMTENGVDTEITDTAKITYKLQNRTTIDKDKLKDIFGEDLNADYAKSERQFRVNGAAVPFPTAHQRRPLFIDFVTLAHAYSVHSFQDGKNVFCQ